MFFIIFFLILLAGIIYCCWHLWLLLPFGRLIKMVLTGACVICVLLLFVSISPLQDRLPMKAATTVYEVGTTALIVLMYLTLIFLVSDLCRLLHIIPKTWLVHNWWTLLTLAVVLGAVMCYGNLHYRNKHRQELALHSKKALRKDYTFIMVSDLHLGYHNRRGELHRWVELMNKEHADAILIAGDIIDHSMRVLREEGMAMEFRLLNAPVYACLGNHEYYAGEPEAQQFYKDAGIHLLRDTAVLLKNDILLVGRDDHTNPRRKALSDILKGDDGTHYTIVMDHQPHHLEEAEQTGVDFQFSGHTHYGQVWPISWITEKTYECAFGSHQRGNTLYYITSGLGIWGAKVRIGTRSEYVVAKVSNSEN